MRYSQYLRDESQIAAADSSGIIARWRWGRRLLLDDTAMSASGKSLRHGIAEGLTARAKGKGIKLTEQEIQRRLRAARAYPTEAQIRELLTDFDSWDELARAGFPAVDRDPDEPDYDPRWTAEKEKTAAKAVQLLPTDEDEQLALFPDEQFGPLSTLSEMIKYADEMREWTDRQARRDNDRQNYLRRLAAAVGGDLSKTWEQAREALAAQDGA